MSIVLDCKPEAKTAAAGHKVTVRPSVRDAQAFVAKSAPAQDPACVPPCIPDRHLDLRRLSVQDSPDAGAVASTAAPLAATDRFFKKIYGDARDTLTIKTGQALMREVFALVYGVFRFQPNDTNEIVQAAFLNLTRYDTQPVKNVVGFVKTVAMNLARNRIEPGPVKVFNASALAVQGENIRAVPDRKSQSPQRRLALAERDHALHEAIEKLPSENWRMTIRLMYFEGLSQAEIADRINQKRRSDAQAAWEVAKALGKRSEGPKEPDLTTEGGVRYFACVARKELAKLLHGNPLFSA